ncbi:ABC transporter substrate-binding protein [Geomicrobium sediminis]|uniref:Peptide/nickel transport system substrate-binding protein n=1 Tax=Geomicrobium sediminis TaxID=1347788 RepID=A0ABS2PBN4_9BACL|nr:peptide/nickel transport system substrate-binding protein [Geomicrobium sediminis]
MKKWLPLSLMSVGLLVACNNDNGSDTTESTDASPTTDAIAEELRVGYPAQPESLDPYITTAVATRDITRHFYEALVTINEDFEVVPMLAESIEESDDGKTITFNLRQGVLFHNGKEMIAEDVVASMERWKETTTQGRSNLEHASFVEVDDYTVELQLDEPSSIILNVLAEVVQIAAIMPKEIVDEADGTGVKEYVGTGPFEFVDWQTDQHIHMQRFEDYVPSDEEASGLSGHKEALVENLYFEFVTDSSTRIAGLQTGEYDVIITVPLDNAEQLEAQPDVELVTALGSLQTGIFNEEEGVFTDPLMRQAVNTAIDNRAIMLGAYVSEEFFTLDAGMMFEDQVDWHSLAGEEYYFQNDPDQALEMLDEAGYDGEEVVILVARDYDALYNTAVVLHQQLEELGMNAVLEVTDWPTYLELSDDPSNFDIAITSFSTRLIPHQYPTLSKRAAYVGWTKSEELDRLLDEIKEQPTQEEAFEVFEELQVQFYEDMPMLNIGKSSGLTGVRSNVHNYEDLIGPILWNTTIED